MCEQRFSLLLLIKTVKIPLKEVDEELRVALWNIEPNVQKLYNHSNKLNSNALFLFLVEVVSTNRESVLSVSQVANGCGDLFDFLLIHFKTIHRLWCDFLLYSTFLIKIIVKYKLVCSNVTWQIWNLRFCLIISDSNYQRLMELDYLK